MTRTASTPSPAGQSGEDFLSGRETVQGAVATCFCPPSLLDLLIAQCADLETLLSLARRSLAAAEASDFAEVLRVVEERATLGERLETYHRQIAEMRLRLGDAAEPAIQGAVARRAAMLASEVLTTDARSRPLLVAARGRLAGECLRVDRTKRGLSAYLRDGRKSALVCDSLA